MDAAPRQAVRSARAADEGWSGRTARLHQHEFGALVSDAYNPGGGWRSTTRLVNARRPADAMVELSRHVYAKRRLVHSLVVRRDAESRMFLYGEYH